MGNRDYLVGETITFKVAVSIPGTKKPVDPSSVVMTRVKLASEPVVVSPTAFTKVQVGEYALILDTSEMDEGVYSYVVTVAGPAGSVLLPDKFTLKTA